MIATIIVGAVVILIVMYVLSKKQKEPKILLNIGDDVEKEKGVSDIFIRHVHISKLINLT